MNIKRQNKICSSNDDEDEDLFLNWLGFNGNFPYSFESLIKLRRIWAHSLNIQQNFTNFLFNVSRNKMFSTVSAALFVYERLEGGKVSFATEKFAAVPVAKQTRGKSKSLNKF